MTLRDVQNEILNYEYSQEYFNMMKECAELDLKAIYLDSQRYIKENAGNIDLPDGYLMESVDDTTLDAMYEEVEQKKAGLLKRLIERVKRLWNALVKAVNHGSKKLEDIEKDRKEFVDLVNAIPDDVFVQYNIDLTKILEKYYKQLSFKCTTRPSKLPAWMQKIIRPSKEFMDKSFDNWQAIVDIAFGDVDKNYELTTVTDQEFVKSDFLEKVITTFEQLTKECTIDNMNDHIDKLTKMLSDSVFSKTIVVNPTQLSKLTSRFNSMFDTITTNLNSNKITAQTTQGTPVVDVSVNDFVNGITRFQAAMSNLIKVYNELIMFRSHVTYEGVAYIKHHSKSKKTNTATDEN